MSAVQSQQHADGTARFRWGAGHVSPCLGARHASSRLSLAGCATFEVGLLSAPGRMTAAARSALRPWLGLGPGVVLAWDPTSRLRLELRAEALTSLVRDRFLLADSVVHQPSSLQGRALIGAGLRLW